MIYLDNAATTFPKPQIVIEEMSKCLKSYCANAGRSAHSLAIKTAEKIFEARQIISDFFGADEDNIVFTYNATYALNIAIKSLINDDAHILISDIEHNAVLRPVHSICTKSKNTYNIFNTNGTDEEIISDINDKITSKTSMIVCNFVSNICSRRLPIKEIGQICKRNNIILIVDGSQGAGHYNINVKESNINALCLPGHKGLYGPQGTGIIIFNNVSPRQYIEGGTGINSLELEMPKILPERLEAGTLSAPSIIGLSEGVKWLKTLNIDRIRSHEEDLYMNFKKCISENDNYIIYESNFYPGNTICFNSKSLTSNFLAKELNERGICVRSGLHCSPLAHKTLGTRKDGAVRISFSVFNTRNDVNELIKALNDISSKHKNKTGI